MGIVKQKRYTCRDIVTSKYERQFDDSVYSTAIAITALAPYCETSGAYTITQNQTGYVLDLSPKDAVEDALNYLSTEQDKDGDWGDLESTAMTVIALDTLGVNADSDGRFVAKNGSAVDGLMQYQQKTVDFRPVRERVTVRQRLWQCVHLQAI